VTSLGAQGEPRPPGSFIGRERELLELRACLADVTAGHGHLFLLSGEPGIGKTRLADEFGRFTVAQAYGWPGAGAGRGAAHRHIGRGSRSFAPA
jgi:MoxR-like ATPase